MIKISSKSLLTSILIYSTIIYTLISLVNGAAIDDPLNAETKTARKDTTSFKLLAWVFGGYTVILIAFGSLACLGIAYVCVRPKA